MKLSGKRIGFAMTGSFCMFKTALACLDEIVAQGPEVTSILSPAADTLDTRFMTADALKASLEAITQRPVIRSIEAAEPIGPKRMFDVLIVLPATGNTLAKINQGITDTAVTMAVKSHTRNSRPVVLGVSSNDALGNNAKNIGALLNMKNIFFVPFFQDDPEHKPRSMIFKREHVIPALEMALEHQQVQPLLCIQDR